MSEDEFLKTMKRKMAIYTIIQRKFGCKCVREGMMPFCSCVEEVVRL